MKCPHCGGTESKVIDTTHELDGSTYRRRRCQECRNRYSTLERVVFKLHIVKRDGRRELFERDKLLDGIRMACAKRPIASETLDRLVEQIEVQLSNLNQPEIPSKTLGDMVIASLKDIDQVAYIRYAIVYMGLSDVESVRDEIDRMLRS